MDSNYKVLSLISGGKDSIYNTMKCVEKGHEIIALANLYPPEMGTEIDSYMYQCVGGQAIENIALALGLPLYRRKILGKPVILDLEYSGNSEMKKGDEVEDLFELIKEIKEKHPEINAVSSGAIASTYQKLRVENICERLGLVSLAYLWNRDQNELLKEMIDNKMESIIIKTASFGLEPDFCLGKTIKELYETLSKLNESHSLNMCGEGGEYETLTLDCPLYKKRIIITEKEVVKHSENKYAPVSYLIIKNSILEDKKE